MKKRVIKTIYSCVECGAAFNKWVGKCTSCNKWGTVQEETKELKTQTGLDVSSCQIPNSDFLNSDIKEAERISIGISELDRVLGGGVVKGSVVLIGGSPGIGKSTLLLQLLDKVCNNSSRGIGLYITGEESTEQVKLRAKRLGLAGDRIMLASINELSKIVKLTDVANPPTILVIDSIQTVYHDAIDSSLGTVTQVRACAFELIRIAKNRNIALIIVGHVTKDGSLAGPKILEHMVDAVLYFEGGTQDQYRLLRAMKNRYGRTNEVGVFEMQKKGLQEIKNPSEIFLPKSQENVSGSCVFAGMEASRPILVEIQALVVPSFLATPRRAVVGWDSTRLAMIIAVLNARYNINLLDKEVYLNVASGFKISEPAADLAVAMALVSAALNKPIGNDVVAFGEIALSGGIRSVLNTNTRIQEASKLGFKNVIAPCSTKEKACNIDIFPVKYIRDIGKFF